MKRPDQRAATAQRIKRTEAYAEKVRKQFAMTVNAILSLSKRVPTLDEGVMFSFDGENAKIQKQVEFLLRQLHSVATFAIKQGIELEWEQANKECDQLVSSVFGKEVLSNPQFSAWNNRNEGARDAFVARSERGLNLSDRVWKSVQQLRDEMEVAITISVGEGESASSMSRKVREYLNDPDLMFRRFRYKNEEGEWAKKWKKREKQPDGSYKWIDYDKDSYRTGAGVYKSSAKNAMRVARTETNIAYRRADNIRWEQMDFVLGQRVQLSRSHPQKDICDKLEGDYPKEFVFDGWHPQCFCFVTPILASWEEQKKMEEAMLKGERYESPNRIKTYPKQFRDWVDEHREQIADARARGTEPYFIRNNSNDINEILNPTPKELTPLERAKLRHEARTDAEVADIKARAEQRQKKHAMLKKTASNVLNVAKDYGEIDTSKLQALYDAGDLNHIQEETRKLAKAVAEMKKQEQALETILVGVHELHKTMSLADLDKIYKSVSSKLTAMPGDLDDRKAKLVFEIDWVGKEGKRRYPDTYKISQDAYSKELSVVEASIRRRDFASTVHDALAYSNTTKSPKVKALAKEMRDILSTPSFDMATADEKAKELNKEYNRLMAEAARRAQKNAAKNGVNVSAGAKTLDELKITLGSSLPKTLDNLNKAIAKYETTKRYGSNAKKYKAEIEELMRKVFDTHDYGMNIKPENIELVLSSKFKNTFETGSSGGYKGSSATSGKIETSHLRLGAAHRLFGLSKDLDNGQLQRNEYEKYGNLLDHDIHHSLKTNTARQYGKVEVRFKKDKVICTWTAGDSLGEDYQPSLTTDPKSCSFDDLYGTPTSKNIDVSDLAKFKRSHISSYLELQYHGEVTIDCVESIAYPYDLTEASYAHDLGVARGWKAKGVKVYYIDKNDVLTML